MSQQMWGFLAVVVVVVAQIALVGAALGRNVGASSEGGNSSFAFAPAVGSEWNVPCGDSGLCSEDNPICCGSAYPFCISGGQRCCSGKYPGQLEGSIGSCGMDQECCVGGRDQMYTVSCCNRTQSCQRGQCVEDICSNTSNSDFCVSHPSCEWCCSTNRCQLRHSDASCTGDLRRSYHERCSDNCSTIESCDTCVAAVGEFGYRCNWCSQSQSCMNSANNMLNCINEQYATSSQQCTDVGPTGRGLSHVEQQHSDLGPIILATLAITVFLVFILSIIRIILHRRRLRAFLQMIEVGEGRSASDVHQRGHGAIARFGFRATREAGSEDEKKEQRGTLPSQSEMVETEANAMEQNIQQTGPNSIKCPLCGIDVQLPNPSFRPPPIAPADTADEITAESKEEAGASEKEGPSSVESPGPTLSVDEHDESVTAMQHEVEDTTGPPSPVANSNERDEGSSQSTPSAGHLSKLVLMLPCYHVACVNCAKRAIELGIEEAKQAESKAQGPTAAQATAPPSTAKRPESPPTNAAGDEKPPPRGDESDNHTKCPHCKRIVECLLVPSRIIRN